VFNRGVAALEAKVHLDLLVAEGKATVERREGVDIFLAIGAR
jgi:hypothetical protein